MKPISLLPKKSQTQPSGTVAALAAYWTLTSEQLFAALHTSQNGIRQTDAESRVKQYGLNALKAQRQTTAFWLRNSKSKG